MRHITRTEEEQIVNSILGERLPGANPQTPFQEFANPRFKIGSRLRLLDGTVWHYAKCGSNGVVAAMRDRGMCSLVTPETLAVIGATPVGATQVVINDTAAVGVHPADYWANGKVELWASVAPGDHQHRMIKSSTASNGVSVTLTLYYPITNALADGDGLEICRSVYAEIDQTNAIANPEKKSIAGVPLKAVTAEYYLWIQTWGMCTIAATVFGEPGIVNNLRQVYWNHADGTIRTQNTAGWAVGNQHAGYLLPNSAGGAQSIVFLQLDP